MLDLPRIIWGNKFVVSNLRLHSHKIRHPASKKLAEGTRNILVMLDLIVIPWWDLLEEHHQSRRHGDGYVFWERRNPVEYTRTDHMSLEEGSIYAASPFKPLTHPGLNFSNRPRFCKLCVPKYCGPAFIELCFYVSVLSGLLEGSGCHVLVCILLSLVPSVSPSPGSVVFWWMFKNQFQHDAYLYFL